MGMRPTRGNENHRSRHPPRRRGPTSVEKELYFRFRGSDSRGLIFRRSP